MKRYPSLLVMLLATTLGGQAAAQLPSTGAESSSVLACFYECKPGPVVQDEPTYQEITTLMVGNNGRGVAVPYAIFFDGSSRAIAQSPLHLTSMDLDELQVCATIARATKAPPPEAGLIQIVDPVSHNEEVPTSVFAWVKNVGGKFFAENPEPFEGRVVGIGKTQCKHVPVPEVNDPGGVLEFARGAPSTDPVLVENTADPELPDLLPIPNQNGFFCALDQVGLVVTIRNQGTGAAGTSDTRVTFPGFGSSTQPTPAVGPGGETQLSFPIPLGCYNPDCNFTISADDADDVQESNETNNVESDLCLG